MGLVLRLVLVWSNYRSNAVAQFVKLPEEPQPDVKAHLNSISAGIWHRGFDKHTQFEQIWGGKSSLHCLH